MPNTPDKNLSTGILSQCSYSARFEGWNGINIRRKRKWGGRETVSCSPVSPACSRRHVKRTSRLTTKLHVVVVGETKCPKRAYSTCSCVTVEMSTGIRHLLVLPADASGLQLLQRIEAETGVSSRCSRATLCDGLTRTTVGTVTVVCFTIDTGGSKTTVIRCTKFENRV